MKTKILFLILAIVFVRCQNDVQLPKAEIKKEYPQEDVLKAIDVFSRTLAYALEDSEFRQIVKEEALLKFDYDFDILYKFLKDKKIREVSVDNFLNTKYNELVKQNKLDGSFDFNELIQIPYNLQISVPRFCEEWDIQYIPEVIANTFVIDENAKLKAYKNDLTSREFSVYAEVDSPIIVVGQSERVDLNGNLTVNSQHIVVPEDMRVTALSAYQNSLANFKSNGSGRESQQSLIQIVNDDAEAEALMAIDLQIGKSEKNGNRVAKSSGNVPPGNDTRISATLVPPILDSRYGTTANTITLNWIGDVNATGYKVFIDRGPGYESAPLATTTAETYSTSALEPGALYRFKVTAFDATGSSLASNETEIRPSPRADFSGESIRRIYITKDRMNQIEPGIFGTAEIEVKVIKSYITAPNTASINTVQNTFYRDPSLLSDKDKWLYYEIPLGNWRTEDNTYIINLIWQEDDGNVSTLKSYDVQVSSEAGFSLGYEEKKLKFGITGKVSKVTTYHYEVAKSYFIIGSTPVFFYESLNTIYDLDGFKWRMRNSGEGKCPYIGTFDGTDCLVGSAPTYPFSIVSSSIYIAGSPIGGTGTLRYKYATLNGVNSGKCLLPGSTLVSVEGSFITTTTCQFRSLPQYSDPYISGNKWYVKTN